MQYTDRFYSVSELGVLKKNNDFTRYVYMIFVWNDFHSRHPRGHGGPQKKLRWIPVPVAAARRNWYWLLAVYQVVFSQKWEMSLHEKWPATGASGNWTGGRDCSDSALVGNGKGARLPAKYARTQSSATSPGLFRAIQGLEGISRYRSLTKGFVKSIHGASGPYTSFFQCHPGSGRPYSGFFQCHRRSGEWPYYKVFAIYKLLTSLSEKAANTYHHSW